MRPMEYPFTEERILDLGKFRFIVTATVNKKKGWFPPPQIHIQLIPSRDEKGVIWEISWSSVLVGRMRGNFTVEQEFHRDDIIGDYEDPTREIVTDAISPYFSVTKQNSLWSYLEFHSDRYIRDYIVEVVDSVVDDLRRKFTYRPMRYTGTGVAPTPDEPPYPHVTIKINFNLVVEPEKPPSPIKFKFPIFTDVDLSHIVNNPDNWRGKGEEIVTRWISLVELLPLLNRTGSDAKTQFLRALHSLLEEHIHGGQEVEVKLTIGRGGRLT